MSACAISQGLINNLSATSVIGSCQVGTNWSVLETTSACCAVVTFIGLESVPWALNNQHERTYRHRIFLYVKDRGGNGLLLEPDSQALFDTAVCSIETDRTMQGDIDIREVVGISGTRDPENSLEIGGANWFETQIVTSITEWP